MPEDYQAILDDLGVDTSEQTDTTPESQETTPVNPTETDTDTAEGTVKEPEATTATITEGDTEDQHRANEAFAAMRAENSKYKKFMQHIMKGANFQGSEEDFMKSLSEASYARQAKLQGSVSPEVLKRMDELESQNRTILDARNRELFVANLKGMQEQLSLNEKDIKEFVDLAVKEHIDLTVPGTNFVTLYQGLFYDKLKARDLEVERQKWIEQNSKANNAANPDGKSGKKDPTPTNVNTMAEFDSLLQSIPNNKK